MFTQEQIEKIKAILTAKAADMRYNARYVDRWHDENGEWAQHMDVAADYLEEDIIPYLVDQLTEK